MFLVLFVALLWKEEKKMGVSKMMVGCEGLLGGEKKSNDPRLTHH